MSVRITTNENVSALFDSVSGLAFGPVFDSSVDAEQFLEFLEEIGERDPRVIPALDLARLHREWEHERV